MLVLLAHHSLKINCTLYIVTSQQQSNLLILYNTRNEVCLLEDSWFLLVYSPFRHKKGADLWQKKYPGFAERPDVLMLFSIAVQRDLLYYRSWPSTEGTCLESVELSFHFLFCLIWGEV